MNISYYRAFENFLDILSSARTIERSDTQDAFNEIADFFSIAKVDVMHYENIKKESEGKDTYHVFFDNEKNCGERVFTQRFVTDVFSVVVYKFHQMENAPEWTCEQLEKLNLISKMAFTFNSRIRLKDIAEKLTYTDDDGYKNLKFYTNTLIYLQEMDKLNQMTAVRYNLKHFSLINQQIGRKNGNIVIKKHYAKLEEILGENGIVCRLGGDNFIIIAETPMTSQIIDFLSGIPIEYGQENEKINISATAGFYKITGNFPFDPTTNIMDRIMSASQLAKTGKSGDMVFYNENMQHNKEQAMKIQNIFPVALEKQEFLVYYQPKVSLDGYTVAGAEALCRWLHNGKLISPADFIPVLESGMEICKLDFYMLDHVCKDIRRWLDEGRNPVRVSVNLSRRHIMDETLLQRIISIVDKNNVPHKYIEIELTETTTDVEFTDLKLIVNGLQEAGISASVDDFGMGYSSLNLIKEIPWNVLKVDKNFLPDENENTPDRTGVMFKYVIAMAREMGLECIVEGVETKKQVELLKKNNCDLAQGFFFDRPLPVADFESRLEQKHYENK